MATITFEIPDKEIKTALERAAEGCGYKLKDGFKVEDMVAELTEDIRTFVTNDFGEFFVEGISADCYGDFIEEE